MLRYTRLGRHTFAIGSSEQTARLCGVAVERVKVIVFMLGGLFAGLAGLMQFSRLTVGDPTVAVGLELDVIAAVVIGGGSLSGGRETHREWDEQYTFVLDGIAVARLKFVVWSKAHEKMASGKKDEAEWFDIADAPKLLIKAGVKALD